MKAQVKVERKSAYQGVPQWGITGSAEITPSKQTAEKWARLENAAHEKHNFVYDANAAKPYFTMTVEMGNAAFEDNNELCRILRDVADRIQHLRSYPLSLRDINGNTVGFADVIE